jgi:hypothetical protein
VRCEANGRNGIVIGRPGSDHAEPSPVVRVPCGRTPPSRSVTVAAMTFDYPG